VFVDRACLALARPRRTAAHCCCSTFVLCLCVPAACCSHPSGFTIIDTLAWGALVSLADGCLCWCCFVAPLTTASTVHTHHLASRALAHLLSLACSLTMAHLHNRATPWALPSWLPPAAASSPAYLDPERLSLKSQRQQAACRVRRERSRWLQ
jgi:hypothetical protein